jgi:hypothetical protein
VAGHAAGWSGKPAFGLPAMHQIHEQIESASSDERASNRW